MPANPVVKARLMNLRKADHHLRMIAHSQIDSQEADLLDAVHKILWVLYRKIENGK